MIPSDGNTDWIDMSRMNKLVDSDGQGLCIKEDKLGEHANRDMPLPFEIHYSLAVPA